MNHFICCMLLLAYFLHQSVHATPPSCESISSGPRAQAPLCPSNGSTLLDDSYPAQAYVVSSGGYSPDREGASEMPSNFIYELFVSHNFSDMPAVFIPANGESFSQISTALRSRLAAEGKNADQINQLLDRLVHIDAGNYTWQQDHFESFIEPSTGNPVLRHVESYGRYDTDGAVLAAMSASGLSCGTTVGPVLQNIESDDNELRLMHGGTSQMGGNIEGLPGGLCMVGNTQAPAYTAQFCSGEENRVEVRTDWLTVGHADEIIKAIPRNPRTGNCPYTFMFASPRKALELMNASPNEAVIDFGDVVASPSETYRERMRNRIEGYLLDEHGIFNANGRILCDIYLSQNPLSIPEESGEEGRGEQTFLNFRNIFFSDAIAGLKLVTMVSSTPEENACLANIMSLAAITNRQFVTEFNRQYGEYNTLVQQIMDQEKQDIRSHYPHCPSANFVDVPNLFYGQTVEGSDPLELAVGTGESFFPNPTNGVRAHNSMIFSHTHNSSFQRYLNRPTTLGGLNARFVDTWNYAHLGSGNLHCSTHTITYCQPNSTTEGTP